MQQHTTAAKSSDSAARSTQRPHADVLHAPTASAPLLQAHWGNAALCRWLQAKLTVSVPDDPLEQEADRAADAVMRMPEPAGAIAQRACAHCAEELQRTPVADREVQRKGADSIQRRGLQAEQDQSADVQRIDDERLQSSIDALPGRGSPLPHAIREYMEPRFNANFSAVRTHTDADAQSLARTVNARAFTVGREIVFGAGYYNPHTETGKRLLAHELTHVVQQGAATAVTARDATEHRELRIHRTPETWLRGEAEGVAPARPGGVIHDFGDGLYLTNDAAVAEQYSSLRAGTEPAAGRVLSASLERPQLGRILDLTRDPRWAEYMRTRVGSLTYEQLIRMANENYWRFFQEFLRSNSLALESFDAIIGPEYVRGGTQLCIRNSVIAEQVRGMLSAVTAMAEPAPVEFRVSTQFRVAQVESIPGGRTVAHVEVNLGEGLEAINTDISARGGRTLPARFTLRITTDASGAFVAADASAPEAAALAETLARQALATVPRGAAAAEGAAAVAARVSPWVRGASWLGLAVFVGLTIYRYQTAPPRERPRVLARAGGGLAGGMLAGYAMCNLVLGIETAGWSLLICAGLAGVPGALAGEAVADVLYDEATIDDDEIRGWVATRDVAAIASLPPNEKLRMIFSLMRGWVAAADTATMERICASVRSREELDALRQAIEPHITELSDIGQRTRLRVALARRID